MKRHPVLLLLLVAACGGPPAGPDPQAQPEPRPATAPAAPVAPTATPAATGRWSAANIDQLVPVPTSHETRTPSPMAADPRWDAVLATLEPVVAQYAGDPQNPWAIAHGLLAMGPSLKLTDGRPAIDALFVDWAEPVAVGGHSLLRFPRSRGDVRIEPHTSLLLKALTETGSGPDRVVGVGGASFTLADLYRQTVMSTWLDIASNHASFTSPDDVPWALQGLAAWAPPGLSWTAEDGTLTDMDTLTTFAAAVLAKETAFMSDAMAQGQGFKREGQGIFRYTCGGAHLLQGTSYAVARGFGGPAARKVIEAQIPLQFYRFPRELAIYDAALQSMPEHKLRLLVQRLKFTGHYLETMHKLAALGFFSPDPQQSKQLADAATALAETVAALKAEQVFDHLPQLRKQDEQLYLDVVGDSSHAMRGLKLALGQGSLAW